MIAKNFIINADEAGRGLKYVLNKYLSDEVTATKIIYQYSVYYNNIFVAPAAQKNNKSLYIDLIKQLVAELNSLNYTISSKYADKNKIAAKKGNFKIEDTTIIINVGAAVTCPSKNKGLCKVCGLCYAENAERQYLNSLIYRLTQTIKFYSLPAEAIAQQLCRRRNIKFIRWNESGDVFDAADLLKIRQVAEICYNKKGLITYLYTAAGKQLKKYQTLYFKINISGQDYIATPNLEDKHADGLYCCGVCKFCLWCKFEFGLPCYVKYHGSGKPAGTGNDLRSAGIKYYHTFIQFNYYYNYEYLIKYGVGYRGGVAL